MKFIAFDISGSNFTNAQRMIACARTFAKPKDMVVTWCDRISKVVTWEQFIASHKAFSFGGPAELKTILDWMESRFISHLDTITLFTDFQFLDTSVGDRHYQIELVDLDGRLEAKAYPTAKVFHIGNFDQRYRLLPAQ